MKVSTLATVLVSFLLTDCTGSSGGTGRSNAQAQGSTKTENPDPEPDEEDPSSEPNLDDTHGENLPTIVISRRREGKQLYNFCGDNPGIPPEIGKTVDIIKEFVAASRIAAINCERLVIEELAKVTELNLEGRQITRLDPLAYLPGLTTLILKQNEIENLDGIQTLTKLVKLNLEENRLTDISLLSGLTRMEELNLGSNTIVDVSPLRGMVHLTTLILDYNNIGSLAPLFRDNEEMDIEFLRTEGNPDIEKEIEDFRATGIPQLAGCAPNDKMCHYREQLRGIGRQGGGIFGH